MHSEAPKVSFVYKEGKEFSFEVKTWRDSDGNFQAISITLTINTVADGTHLDMTLP